MEMEKISVQVIDGYQQLFFVLAQALEQAQCGKGAERHASEDVPFTQQPLFTLCDQFGAGFALGQAAKKLHESQRLSGDAAEQELMGAIVYTAAAILHRRKEHDAAVVLDNTAPEVEQTHDVAVEKLFEFLDKLFEKSEPADTSQVSAEIDNITNEAVAKIIAICKNSVDKGTRNDK